VRNLIVFTFIDEKNNNTVELTAPSKSQAMKRVKTIGMEGLRYDSQRPETNDECLARMGRDRKRQQEQDIKDAETPKVLRRRKAFSRNDKCPCNSGKKVKHCCGARGRRNA